MTTLLRSVPGQPNIRIQYLDESLQFIGNNVQTISIDDVRFGCSFILDEFDSLKEIEIKKPGAVISFNSFPKQTIRIKGAFEEIRVKDGSDFYNLHRYGSNPTLPIGNLWGAVVTRDETTSNKGADAILIKTDGIKDLSISDEWSHITVIGDKKLQQIGVTGNSVIRSFHVHKGPALKSVKLERRVLLFPKWVSFNRHDYRIWRPFESPSKTSQKEFTFNRWLLAPSTRMVRLTSYFTEDTPFQSTSLCRRNHTLQGHGWSENTTLHL